MEIIKKLEQEQLEFAKKYLRLASNFRPEGGDEWMAIEEIEKAIEHVEKAISRLEEK